MWSQAAAAPHTVTGCSCLRIHRQWLLLTQSWAAAAPWGVTGGGCSRGGYTSRGCGAAAPLMVTVTASPHEGGVAALRRVVGGGCSWGCCSSCSRGAATPHTVMGGSPRRHGCQLVLGGYRMAAPHVVTGGGCSFCWCGQQLLAWPLEQLCCPVLLRKAWLFARTCIYRA